VPHLLGARLEAQEEYRLVSDEKNVDASSIGSKGVRTVGRTEATKEAILLLELAIARSQADRFADDEFKDLIRGALEAAKHEVAHLEGQTPVPQLDTGRFLRGRVSEDADLAKQGASSEAKKAGD
jgi:hypothetical protein